MGAEKGDDLFQAPIPYWAKSEIRSNYRFKIKSLLYLINISQFPLL